MKRKNIKGIFLPPMNPDAAPVIENSSLTVMPEIKQDQPGQIKNPPKGKGLMPSATTGKPKVNKAAITKGLQMAPFDKKENEKIKIQKPDVDYPEQMDKKTRKKKEHGYIVLRMRVQDGEISVIGSRKVAGPFLEHSNLVQSGITYEAFLKNSRIAIGSIVDFGEQRSFPRPDADPSREGHHITALPGFDFNVKIPAEKITLKDLPSLNISLYRFKEHVADLRLTELPLKTQFAKEVRVVAEMNGIRTDRLRDDVKKSIKQMFKN
jgi:hypothetical protein